MNKIVWNKIKNTYFIKIGPFDTKLLQKAHKWFLKKSCLHPVPKFGEKFGEKYREKFGTFDY